MNAKFIKLNRTFTNYDGEVSVHPTLVNLNVVTGIFQLQDNTTTITFSDNKSNPITVKETVDEIQVLISSSEYPGYYATPNQLLVDNQQPKPVDWHRGKTTSP